MWSAIKGQEVFKDLQLHQWLEQERDYKTNIPVIGNSNKIMTSLSIVARQPQIRGGRQRGRGRSRDQGRQQSQATEMMQVISAGPQWSVCYTHTYTHKLFLIFVVSS